MSALPRALAAAAVVLAAAAVVRTYPVFSQFFDEPAHLATGMEWVERGSYTLEPLHPPVARALTAVLPFIDGARGQGSTWLFAEGNSILHAQGTYARTLGLSRLGVLPFFLLLALVVWAWARRVHGEWPAAAAVVALVTLPPVLAHAGIAATDMGHTATLMLALYSAMRWLESPTPAWSAAAGAAAGLAAATKFSAGIYYPPACVAFVAAYRLLRRRDAPPGPPPRAWITGAAVAVGSGLLVLLAAYRFDPGPFFAGLAMLREHQARGLDAFLLGQTGSGGWWYFFPVTLAVKTPIPFALLALAGAVLVLRHATVTRDWRALSAPAAALLVLALAMTSRVTIGLRHVLPIYPLLAIVAGVALWRAWTAPRLRLAARVAVVALLGWQAAATARAHPDYLAWFNAVAGRHPERIIVAGDLDWGQDLLRLADTLRARSVPELALAYYGSGDPRRLLTVPVRPLAPDERAHGWLAASEAVIAGVGFEPHRGFEWLDSLVPVARVGRTIRLYHRPAPAGEAPLP